MWDIHLCATYYYKLYYYKYSIIAYYWILLLSLDNSLVIVKYVFLSFSHVYKKIQLDRIVDVTTELFKVDWLYEMCWNLVRLRETSDHTVQNKSHF